MAVHISGLTESEEIMGKLQDFLEQIEKPSEEFTPIPFWFFNDTPDEERIAAQLADYVDKGVNGIVLHPRIGVPREIPYLSEAYFAAVKFIVKTAHNLGMKVVLYDEGMYPSGSAHGQVVEVNPDFASRGITLAEEPENHQVITRFSDGKYLVYGFTNGTIRGIHFGEDDGEEGAPKSADILNPEAVEEFIRLTHDRYYEELKEYFGNTVIGFFTDEPCALGRNAGNYREWVPGMEEELVREGGQLQELRGLFTGEENPTTLLYHKLIKKYLREIFYARLSKWCENHGIDLMGHPAESDDVEEELYFHVPGQDLIMRRVSPESGGIREFDSVQAKLSADIARLLGRRRNANECFGVCSRKQIPWYFTGFDMKWYINWLGIRGVNLYIPHAFYYSVTEKRKDERPPDVGPHNIWWPYYRKFSDYIKRISFLMTDSISRAGVAVLCDNNRVPYEEIACLYEHQIDFHYLPVAMLPDCKIEDGRVYAGNCIFEVLVDVEGRFLKGGLNGVRIVQDAEELTGCLEKGRGACKSSSTAQNTGTTEEGTAKEAGTAGIGKNLRTVHTSEICKGLRAVHLVKDGVEWYLFSNEGMEVIETQITLPGMTEGLRPVMVDLWSGKAENCRGCADGTADFSLLLKPCEMKLVLLKEAGETEELCSFGEMVSRGVDNVDSGDWTERFLLKEERDNRRVYSYHFQVGTEQHDSIKEITGRETFTVTGEEMVECYCNGSFVDVSFYGPHTFTVGPCLRMGENEVELIVTGNAANLYGGARIPYGLGAAK